MIKIPIEADTQALNKKLDGLSQKIDQINSKKWSPVDPGAIERDARKVEGIIVGAQQRIKSRSGPSPSGTDDGGGGSNYRIRRRYTYSPEFSDIPRAAVSSLGGGFGQVASYAARGAQAGAAEGGIGGAAGLLRGSAIGAGIAAIFKIGQVISEGTDLARERGTTLDTLKRQMGDVGVSFDKLRLASESAAYGLGINSKDFAVIEAKLNTASRGADHSPFALADSANVVGGFARSYGLDPGSTAGLFGSARNVNQRQSYREFATILAETIERSSMAAQGEEVVQALVSFSATSSRLALALPNLSGYAGAYSGLINSGITGLTPEVSSAILGQAGSAVVNLGAAGEAGQAFTLAAMQHGGGHLNPLEAIGAAGGGLFGKRSTTFGPDSALGRYLGADAAKIAGPGGPDEKTNFELIRDQIGRVAGGTGATAKLLQAEMAQRYFGLQSINQAAALMALKPEEIGGINTSLTRAGIDPNNVNYSNIQTIAKISNAKGGGDLDAIYSDLKGRTGTSALGKGDTAAIESARKGGNLEDYRNAMIKAASQHDYTQDAATIARDSKVVLDDIKTSIGDKLYGKVDEFQADMVTLLGGRKKLDEGKILEADSSYQDAANAARVHHDARERQIQAQGGDVNAIYANDKEFRARIAGYQASRDAAIIINIHMDSNGNIKSASPNAQVSGPPRGQGAGP